MNRAYCHNCNEFVELEMDILGHFCSVCGQHEAELILVSITLFELMQKWHLAYRATVVPDGVTADGLPDFTKMAREYYQNREGDA